jgi:hypothetical protein
MFSLKIYESPDQAQPQLYSTQVFCPSSTIYPQAMSNRQSIQAKRAYFYSKQEGHFIRKCPNKRLHQAKRKAMRHNIIKGGN